MRVLVTETLSEQGLDLLSKDFQVDVRTDLAAGPLAAEIGPYRRAHHPQRHAGHGRRALGGHRRCR